MPTLFWIDIAVSCIATIVSAALILIALAAGPRQSINGSFAVFMAVQFLWGCTYMAMRLALWLRAGNPQSIAEWNALTLFLTGICLFIFSNAYVQHHSRRSKWMVLAGILVIMTGLPQLFKGHLVYNIRLHPNGTTLADVSMLAVCYTSLLVLVYLWAFVMFWKNRKQPGSTFMAYSVLILFISFIIKGILEVPYPLLSFAHFISIGILGYGVLSRQLFNPLKTVTDNLKKEIIDRRRAEKALVQSLNEKDMLLKEIHHRVKNNMQIVTSLLKLQTEEIKNKNLISFLDDCRHRVQSMAMIHEMLYRVPNFTDVPFGEYVKKLVATLCRSYGTHARKVRFTVQTRIDHLDLNRAIPCGLIINEIVSNALKHAFPDAFKGTPTVMISMRPSADGRMHLSVRDNGVGLPMRSKSRGSSSLGMRLIRILAEDQLEGKVEVNGRNGTSYRIVFPIA
ncbi:MAG TPA: sensor histidine kinase [bacterium]